MLPLDTCPPQYCYSSYCCYRLCILVFRSVYFMLQYYYYVPIYVFLFGRCVMMCVLFCTVSIGLIQLMCCSIKFTLRFNKDISCCFSSFVVWFTYLLETGDQCVKLVPPSLIYVSFSNSICTGVIF